MRTIDKIIIEVIPHAAQRYETVGDYYFDEEENLRIKVSKLPDNRMELLIMVHELIEVLLTEYRGIPEQSILDFDLDFEQKRVGNFDEPGDDVKAPYKKEHCIATSIERLMCSLLDLDWKTYEKACNAV